MRVRQSLASDGEMTQNQYQRVWGELTLVVGQKADPQLYILNCDFMDFPSAPSANDIVYV